MKYLSHNGVLIPERYKPKGFHIKFKGKDIALTPLQEEMAGAWVKKLGTEYVQDPVFVRNFLTDFSKELGVSEKVEIEEFDFSEIMRFVEAEKQARLFTPKEEKKRLAEERKKKREDLKEKYGCAIVDNVKAEVANYLVEPACIFMGRGKHPLRGRWKPAADIHDIILNLIPDAPRPPGSWKEIVWQPDSMWIAKWDDKLRGVEKYIWLADSSHIKQEKDIEKFEAARQLEKKISALRKHIEENLASPDVKRRKIATVCYLIDALKIRVGDEKDEDEADTVGATTLRPEHVTVKSNNVVRLDFLGKDSVRFNREVSPPEQVVKNIQEFVATAKSSVFQGVRSDVVSDFLGEVTEGLTAKVFRTYHASKVVREFLAKTSVEKAAPDYVKKHAAVVANLQAAIALNHKKKVPKKWQESLDKKKARLKVLKEKKKKSVAAIEKLKLKIEEMKEAKEYNLGTSLKSYIDPRIYRDWSKTVDFDWRLYYPKTLQRKFSWIEQSGQPS